MRNHHAAHSRLLDMSRLLHHWLLRMSYDNVSTSKEASIAFRPIGKFKVMNVKRVLDCPSSNVVGQFEMISFLHNSMVKEHSMAAYVPNKFLPLAMVGSKNSPFSHILHSTFEVNSKFTLLALAFLVPIED